MGTFSYSVSPSMRHNGGAQTVLASTVRTSGAYTTSTTASNLEDASGDITLAAGEMLYGTASEAMRIAPEGGTATASTGHPVAAGETISIECLVSGTVSIIDVA